MLAVILGLFIACYPAAASTFESPKIEGKWKLTSPGSIDDCDSMKGRPCGWTNGSRENFAVFSNSNFSRIVIGYSDQEKTNEAWIKEVRGTLVHPTLQQK